MSQPMTLHRIQGHLRASNCTGAPRVGPFLLTYAPDDTSPFRNYAIPDDGAHPSADEVQALIAWFRDRQRSPRLEYVAPADGVELALLAAGFTVERRLPLMVLDTLAVPPAPQGAELLLATEPARLRACARVQNAAYGAGDQASDGDVARLARANERGGAVALALLDGEPASSGVLTRPVDGLAELAAVGTTAHLRGRGLASAVVALLSQAALDRGATPYLQAESEREAALYARLGYRRIGELTLANGPRTS
jgi:GNAT superfamily N-acetyltransferase